MKLDAILKNEKFIYGVYQGLLFTVGFVTLLSFQNCSKSLKANVVQQASKAGAVGGESVKCELDGKSLNDQESNYFYSSQQPPDGKTCDEIKGNRKCVGGQLTGLSAYRYSECTDVLENGTLVCNLDGVSATEGSVGIFYSQQFAKSQNECAQYQINASCVRKQNNQASFSFADDTHFGSCQAGIDCNDPVISGKSYAQGTEVIFSNIKNPAVGVICSESNTQRRICNNGVFSGDATFMFADIDNKDNSLGGCINSAATSCNKTHANVSGSNELISIPDGQSQSFYASDNQVSGALCEQNKETFTCKNGVLTDSKGNKIIGDNATDLKYRNDGCVSSANYCKYVQEGPGVKEVNPFYKRWKNAVSEHCDNEVQILYCLPGNVIPTFSTEYKSTTCSAPGEDRTKPKFIGAIESVKATENQIKVSGWACVNKDRKAPASDQVFDLTLWALDKVTLTNVTKMITLSSSDLTLRTDALSSCVNYNSNLAVGTKAQFEFIINKGSDGNYSILVGQYVQVLVTDNNSATSILTLNHLLCSTTSCENKGANYYKFPDYLTSTNPSYMGFLEPSYVKNGKTYIGGWACEKGNKNPVTVSIYVKTDNGPRQIWTVEAKQERANFNNACGSGVASHGFEVEINDQMVQQFSGKEIFAAIYISTGNYSELSVSGVRPVIKKMDQKPVGRLDAIGNLSSKHVSGWAYDPYDLTKPVNVHFYQCSSSTGCASFSSGYLGLLTANGTFEVDKNTVAYGFRFDGAIGNWINENTPGDQFICAYAINPRGGTSENVLLGCQKALRSCYYYKFGNGSPHLDEYANLGGGLVKTACTCTQTTCPYGGPVGSENYYKCVVSHIDTFGVSNNYCN